MMDKDEEQIAARINNTLGKFAYYLSNHDSICVGVSGGSDSNIIVHIIGRYFREYLPKIHFCFCDTGLEYKATRKHIDFLEKEYDITIDRVRGKSVVSVIHHNGVPIISKEFSYLIHGCQENKTWAIKRLNRTKEDSAFALSQKQKLLAEYLINNHIRISNDCCNVSKKRPYHKYLTQCHADLTITGERRCEGGQRATRHKDCFSSGKGKSIDKYMPLFFWTDDVKQYYKEKEGIVYSDCYEVWGMKRTGCVGCPYNSRVGEDLDKIKQYEPNMYKACIKIFGQSYQLMDKFNIHRQKIFNKDGE